MLRRTIIKGLPNDFLEFQKFELEKEGTGDLKKEFAFRTIGPKAESKVTNIRARVWQIVCKLEEVKEKLLRDYHTKRQGEIKLDPSLANEWPIIFTPVALYEFYKNKKANQTLFLSLQKDVGRCDPGNKEFNDKHNPCTSGNNPVFNLMNAYAHYDPEIEYCQGINVVMSWILKFTRTESGKCTIDGHKELAYNEVDAFYIFVHIVENLEYRRVYDQELSKLKDHLDLIESVLMTGFPEIYEHFIDSDIDMF